MSTNVGTLQIEIATNVARIRADMDAAKQIISASMKDVEQYVGFAKTAFVGLIGVGSVAAFKGMIDSAIEGKVRLYNLSLQTGISVEALSALGKVAKYTDTSLADIASASNKLSKNLFTQTEDSKGAAQAIKALGLNFNDFKGLGADEQMLKVAKAMAGFQDGTGKSATAMMLFGKAGALLLPFLAELAEKNELVGKQTTESAKQAKAYEDNLITIKAASEAWRRELADFLLPALVNVTNELLDGKKAYGSYAAAILDVLNGSTTADGLAKTRGEIGRLKKDITDLESKGGTPSLLDRLYPSGTQVQGLKDELALLEKRKTFQEAREDRADKASFDRIDAMLGGRKKPEIKLDDGKAGGGATKTIADGYDTLMLKIREKIALDQAEVDIGRKLTETEKFQITVYNEVEKNFDKLSIVKMLAIDEATQLAIAAGKEREAFEAEVKWMNEASAANATYLEGQMQLRNQLQDATKAAVDQLRMFGLTTEELRDLETARLRDAAAALQQKAAQAELAGGSALSENSRLFRELAQAFNDTADARARLAAKQDFAQNDPYAGAKRAVKDYLADLKHAGDATYGAVANSIKGLEDLTVTALSGGDVKNAARGLVSGIISEFNRLYVVKPLMAEIFGSAGGAGGSGGGWLGTAISLVGGFFNSGNSGLNSAGDGYYSNEGRNFGGPRAGGGGVNSGTDYLVGEKGPELLRMGSRGGTVIPNSALGSGSRPVTVNVMNNGQAVQAKSSQRETSEGTVIDLVLDAVAADMASGGKVHDATQRRFGLNPGGTTPRY